MARLDSKNLNKTLLIVWIISSLIGIILVLPEDSGPAVVRLSATHGPSSADIVGLALVLVGATAQWAFVTKNVSKTYSYVGPTKFFALVGVLLLGLCIIALSVLLDYGKWWIGGIAICMAAFIWFVTIVMGLSKTNS